MNFTNLKNEIRKEITKEHGERLKTIEGLETANQIFDSYQTSELLTKLRQEQVKSGKLSLADAKFLMIKKQAKNYEQKLKKELDAVEEVENSKGDLESITINVEWAKGSMSANQASAEVEVVTTEGYNRYYGGKTGGFGYDKESTTVGRALNQSKPLLKLLYAYKEKAMSTQNRDLFGYGSGYGLLPYFEGGVGISCYYRIFERIGFEMKHISNGKKFDVYTVSKIK